METNTAFAQSVAPSIDVIKAKQKATWEDGNYASFEPAIRKHSGRQYLAAFIGAAKAKRKKSD